jgi:cytochrome c-type biogenesis protein CcsB
MGELSNELLVVTILCYVFAMLAYAIEYAFGGRSAVARVAQRELVQQRELVPAGGADVPAADPLDAVPPPPVAASPIPARVGRLGVALTLAGALAHAATLVTRGLAAGRVPWGNMYEFVIAVSLVGTVAWLVVLTRRPQLRHLGLFVSLVAALLLAIAGMELYTPAGPLVPALHSYWLVIHVTAAILASGILLVGFVAATLHLIRTGYDNGKRRFPYGLADRLPAADTLERLTFRVHAFAFPIWTFAIMCGAIWAEAAWGRYWGWDPKETWSFIAWVIYACYLHARSTPSVSRRITSWIAVAGWCAMLINLYGVNIFASSFHSYSGLK